MTVADCCYRGRATVGPVTVGDQFTDWSHCCRLRIGTGRGTRRLGNGHVGASAPTVPSKGTVERERFEGLRAPDRYREKSTTAVAPAPGTALTLVVWP